MGDADAARSTKHLGEISHSLKQLVRIFSTVNENFVAFAKKMEEMDTTVTIETVHTSADDAFDAYNKMHSDEEMNKGMTRKEDRSDAEEVHDLTQDINAQSAASGLQSTVHEPQPTDSNDPVPPTSG